MLTRLTLVGGVAAALLTFAAPALASPGSLFSHVRQRHALREAIVSAKGPKTATTTLYVNHNTGIDQGACTSAAAPCQTIGYAVGQAPTTATIKVAAGTYAEQVDVVSKNLTIIGAGSGKTTIAPASVTPNQDFSGLYAVVAFEYITSGGLKNLTVEGTASESSATNCESVYSEVSILDSSATLSGDTLLGSSAPNACVEGASLYAFDESNEPNQGQFATSDGRSVTVQSSTVDGYGVAGFACGYESCTITKSKVIGPGITPNSTSGIYMILTPSATVNATSVTNNTEGTSEGAGALTSSAGVFDYDSGQFSATHMTLTSNDIGVDVVNDIGTPPDATTISANKIQNSTDVGGIGGQRPPVGAAGDGIQLAGPTNATVTANAIKTSRDVGVVMVNSSGNAIGGPAADANTISGSGYAGIWVGAQGPGAGPNGADVDGPSISNTIQGNTVTESGEDGIYVQGTDSGGNIAAEDNVFDGNSLSGSGLFGAMDNTVGTGTLGTANTWLNNTCNPAGSSSPSGLCS